MDAFRQDLRYALRRLSADPAFTAAIVLTLALGIGANTAMFSVVRAVLLRPLPYPEPERLVVLWQADPERGIHGQRVTPANYADWRVLNRVFDDIAVSPAWQGSRRVNIVTKDGNRQVAGAFVSAGFFPVLRVQPLIGRTFGADEDRVDGPLAAVLSHALWLREFGGDPNILGKPVTVDSFGLRAYTVVGVMPSGFRYPEEATEIWLNVGWLGGVKIPPPGAADRCCSWLEAIARLKPGVSIEQARSEMNAIAGQIARQHPGSVFGPRVEVVPLLEQRVGSARMQLLLLLGAVGCVLLIGCANVANLLLSRVAGRRREMAVRLALGARPGDIIRQSLVESCVLAFAGGVAGVLLALWIVQILISSAAGMFPRADEARLDTAALLFSLLVSIAAGVLAGLAPSRHSAKTDINAGLKAGDARGPAAGRRISSSLVISQVALTLTLLLSAGLLVRSLAKLSSVSPGFRVDHVLTLSIDMTSSAFDDPNGRRALFQQFLDRVHAIPAVLSAGAVSELPLSSGEIGQAITIDGSAIRAYADSPIARTTGATAGYFRTLGVPLLRGHLFTEDDGTGAPTVVVINETMARRYWPGLPLERVIGRRVVIGSRDRMAGRPNGQPNWMDIVGIVGDVRAVGLDAAPIPELYMSYRQWPWHEAKLVVHTGSDPARLAASIRGELRAFSKHAVVTQVRTMEQIRSVSLSQPRFRTFLLLAFSLTAVLLAIIGIYGVMSRSVVQRTRELGIRMAMGAESRDVVWQVIKDGMRLVALGMGIGLAASFAASRLLSRFLFDLSTHDPATLAGVIAVLGGVAFLSMLLPALHATKIDPMVALRHE